MRSLFSLWLVVAVLVACLHAPRLVSAQQRTFTFINQCSEPVWFGIIAGAAGTCSDGCPQGSSCDSVNNLCFWNTPSPSDGNFQLAANGGKNSVDFPFYDNGVDFVFSGAIAGRTGCDGPAPCEIANCVQSGDWGGPCTIGTGFSQPATQAEFTLSKTGSDYYDVEVINGISLPTTMAPDTQPTNPTNPYWCGSGGARNPSPNVMGACSWNYNPPTNEFVWVAQGGGNCGSDNDCGGSKCGLAVDFPGRNGQKTCGKQLGYWSANQICGMMPNYQGSFQCGKALGGGLGGLTLTSLFGCSGGPINSCYQPGADPNTCCGCVNWDQVGVDVPPAPYTTQCVAEDPQWTSGVLPQLQWMKEGCPTTYTYPFDDESSTFTCSDLSNGQNTLGYTITFC